MQEQQQPNAEQPLKASEAKQEIQPILQPPAQTPASPPPVGSEGLLQELWRKRFYILKAAAAVLAFWLLEFAYQYYALIPGELQGSLVRSFALAGATLIGVALAIGPLFVLRTQLNFIEYRRTVGVAGFTLVCLHFLSVMAFFFNFNFAATLWDLNPFKNPLVFGSLALTIFAALFLTSTDWAVRKLGFRQWKTLHRLVYLAYLLSVLHFTQINPALLYNPAGYLLLLVTAVALLLELAAFAVKVRKGVAGKGAWAGAALIAFALAMLAIAVFFKKTVTG